jgi:glycosyl transferase family 25
MIRTQTHVISLASSAARREAFSRLASGAGASWAFSDASTGVHPELAYDEEAAIAAVGRPLRPAELGCYSSHYALWLALLGDETADQYVVLEDDVEVDWTFLAALARLDARGFGSGYIRLFYRKPAPFHVVAKGVVDGARKIVSLHDYCFGTQGYLISKPAAARLVEHCRVIRRPIDNALDRWWSHGVENLSFFPFPMFEKQVGSTVQSQAAPAGDATRGAMWTRAQDSLQRRSALLRRGLGWG